MSGRELGASECSEERTCRVGEKLARAALAAFKGDQCIGGARQGEGWDARAVRQPFDVSGDVMRR
jgi:hypothetical protein